ncbi:putative peptidoglycan binding protein [Ancylobacter aquaticus]|uniref:Putative peptidoglycan binding protein n=1 Tax=Ancylobacter aquaticus TaxID=100 RepID=A0A4R1HZD3_ANCAQ|nr:N-acetylmuramidase domain-containing protein [Ancylobacter aquaticus]TCK28187.1 putative peptidoglycan binding protein [Ancylobacter aquaticus]
MTAFGDFTGRAERLDDIDLPRIASRIGVGEDELHALIEVETKGGGFDSRGRPRILFEPHVFYRCLSGAKRDKAVAQGLAYAKWGQKPYGKESEQYPRLVRAMAIDETAALKACSWGLPQILGENHAMIGFSSVQDMVRAFLDDEEAHLEAMVAFIRAAKIDDDLRRIAALNRPSTAEDWREVARPYNGPKYAKHGYHTRLAKAHVKWRGIRDTAWSAPLPPARPADIDLVAAPAQIAAPAMTEYEVRALQQQLKDALYDPGFVDGKMGTRTRAELFAVQTDNGLPATGEMNPETRAFILTHGVPTRHLAPERETATAASLAGAGRLPPAAQAALKGGFWAKVQAAFATVAMMIYGAWEQSGDTLSALSPFKEDLFAAGPWLFFGAVIAISLVLWLRSRNAVDQTVRAVRLGRDTGA